MCTLLAKLQQRCFYLLFTKDTRQGKETLAHTPPISLPSRSQGHSLRRRLVNPRSQNAQQRWRLSEQTPLQPACQPVQVQRKLMEVDARRNSSVEEATKSSPLSGLWPVEMLLLYPLHFLITGYICILVSSWYWIYSFIYLFFHLFLLVGG